MQKFAKYFARQKPHCNRFKGAFYAFLVSFAKLQSFLKNKKIYKVILFYSQKVVQFCKKAKKSRQSA
jgi:hypothetical protein